MDLAAALLAIMVSQAPPGRTAFSVEPVAACAGAQSCSGARYSSHYGTWVLQESAETGKRRYAEIATAYVAAVDEVLVETKTKAFARDELAAVGMGVAIIEGGLREDVMVGRGWAKKADDVGGRGRGPGFEACLPQIHPSIAWRFADKHPLTAKAAGGDVKARFAIARTLLGRDQDALRRCFRAELRMLVHGAQWCNRANKAWGAIAMFVNGDSCTADRGRKTTIRYNLAKRILWALRGGKAQS